MTDTGSVTLSLLGKEYRISCPVGERDNLMRAAALLDERMREIRDENVVGSERIAVMAALNLAHEMLQTQEVLRQQSDQDSRIQSLLQRVESELLSF